MKSLNDRLLEKGLVRGHFIFASKRHGLEKFDFDRIAESRRLKRKVARGLGALIAADFPDCDAVITVANGANCLSAGVAKEAGKRLGRPILAMYTGKLEAKDDFYIQRGNIYVNSLNCVIVDDVYNHGTNTGKVARLVTRFGGFVNGVAVVLNRSQGESRALDFDEERPDVPVASLIERPIEDYEPEDCPLAPCDLHSSFDVVERGL